MNSLDFLLLKDVTRKQGAHQQHNKNKKRPGAKELLGCSFGSISYNPVIIRATGVCLQAIGHAYHHQGRSQRPKLSL